MMKIVIGILRDSKVKIQDYIDKGYHIECLDNHARIFGERLIKKELSQEEVQRVRKSGYKTSSRYWINLALLSAKGSDKIVIVNLQEEDNKRPFSKIV